MEWPLCQELSDLVVDALVNQGESLRNAALLYDRLSFVPVITDTNTSSCIAQATATSSMLSICGSKEDQAATHASVLERLLELVASVKLIHFEGIPWDHLSFIGNSKGKRYNIPMVDLRQTVVASYHALSSFIQAFPKLHTLALLSVSLGNDSSVSNLAETESPPLIPRVRILELDNCRDIFVRLSNDIAQNSAPLSVRHLRILRILAVREASDLTSIKTIIEKSGGIPLKLRVGDIQADPEELIALSFPPSLNHLHLNLNDYEHKNEQDILRWWIKYFSCPDIKLSKIHVSLYADPHYPRLYRAFVANVFRSTFFHRPFALPPNLAPDEDMSFHLIEKELWSELDNALAEIHGLKEFMIKLPSEGDAADFESLKDAIKEGMPRARDRGLLVFRMKRGI
ncbi:hypothetical protein ARMSODRAFT_1025327 [Armillaria solidipes]|uniref:Uncharacterized protein n=1 Tax=Armillaria solidipes TaxID=1076256 RepID=A0A2H3BB15_9AGAR|nr:hypothetical protein ARMSODRAFT_1025327 [Armillaria solidipes]